MAPVRLPATRPSELLTVAVTGGRPTASSTGKVTRVPEPTTALIEPATRPAANTPDEDVDGFLDGQGLAIAGGRCWAAAARIPGFVPLPERDVVLLGARDLT